ncbi:uncharacterized protein LOC105395767 [Plutella xylostella]|uniref:uncharacterized protein LOC105395767 n=1 Tax=Plutella xylostella TaxID=51655 RepID=UPI0020325DE5|nr:uncharacterized protein LOC105395767 [Plutella xylostella]
MSIFGEKPVMRENRFSSSELIDHLESLVKSAKDTERRRRDDGYSWLKSKSFEKDNLFVNDAVADLKPMLDKLTPEGCSAIAVKLDSYTESAGAVTAAAILRAFKIYVEDEHELQMMKNSVKDMKFKNRGLKRNKVRPELLPPGREATVSFILDADSHE